MRFLLAGILGLLPLSTHTASPDCTNIVEPGSCAATDLCDAEAQVAPHTLPDWVRRSGDAYSPAPPTNFETLIGPYTYAQERDGIVLYSPLSLPTSDVCNCELSRMGPADNRKAPGHSSTQSFLGTPAAPADWFRDTHSHCVGRNFDKPF